MLFEILMSIPKIKSIETIEIVFELKCVNTKKQYKFSGILRRYTDYSNFIGLTKPEPIHHQ